MNILEARRRTLGKGVYKKTVEGNPAIAQGSLARMYPGITMQGWTEQAQYEGNQLFDASVFDGIERSGVRVSVDNGVITASGMSESAIWIQSANFTEEDFEKFKSGNIYVKNYKTSECNYEVGIYINNTTVKEGNPPYPIPDGYLETKPNNVYFFIDIRAGIELKGSCKPMIYQDGDGTYEPYTGGQPSPNPDYPQPITSAGKYDEGTQKYQYEINVSDAEENPTKSQTVTLTSDRPLTKWDKLEKRNGQWGWVYKSTTLKMDENVNVADANGEVGETAPYRLYGAIGVHKSEGKIACISNILRGISNSNWNSNSAIGTYLMNDGNVNFRLKSEWVSDANAAKQFLIEHDAYFMYETAEETFVPLSESEQEQMNALHTYYPTTVLSNDCGCNMTLTYKTKKGLEVTD